MLYLANIWDETISERGLQLLEGQFGSVKGNWLRGARKAEWQEPDPAFLIIAPSVVPGSVVPSTTILQAVPSVVWTLFPDQMLGWDFQAHQYLFQIPAAIRTILDHAPVIAANSAFTAALFADLGDFEIDVCLLGIDTETIRLTQPRPDADSALMVIWNHMWRTQKNFHGALEIILLLAQRFPAVDFVIGRQEDWADQDHSPAWLKDAYATFQAHVKRQQVRNIRILPHKQSQHQYWTTLSSMDIAFSCSYEESFGFGMLEAANAGLACVVPDRGAYTELHSHALITAPNDAAVAAGLERLICDTSLRQAVAQAGREQTQRLDVRATIETLTGLLIS